MPRTTVDAFEKAIKEIDNLLIKYNPKYPNEPWRLQSITTHVHHARKHLKRFYNGLMCKEKIANPYYGDIHEELVSGACRALMALTIWLALIEQKERG